MKNINIVILGIICCLSVLFSCASTPEPQPVQEPVEEVAEPEYAGPIPFYMHSRYRELLNNSMYELSQPRAIYFDTRLFPQSRVLEDPVDGIFVFVQGDDFSLLALREMIGLGPQELDNVFRRRGASWFVYETGEASVIVLVASNIDSILIEVEQNTELQELILHHLGAHFRDHK